MHHFKVPSTSSKVECIPTMAIILTVQDGKEYIRTDSTIDIHIRMYAHIYSSYIDTGSLQYQLASVYYNTQLCVHDTCNSHHAYHSKLDTDAGRLTGQTMYINLFATSQCTNLSKCILHRYTGYTLIGCQQVLGDTLSTGLLGMARQLLLIGNSIKYQYIKNFH